MSLAAVRQRVHHAYESLWNKGDESSRQQANAIFRAFEIPDDEENTWLVGDQTVLVGWGHVKAHARVLRPAELVVDLRPAVENPASLKISTKAEPIQQGRQEIPASLAAPPLLNVSRAIPAIAALLWLAFVVLAGAAGWRLLEACSVEVLGRTIYASSSGVCELRAQNSLSDVLAQNRTLVDALRSEQISLLSRPFCRAPPPPPRTLPVAELTEGEERARQQGADLEGLAGVTLEWHSRDDLDLLIECPRGRMITPRKEQKSKTAGCGDGVRDVDANDTRKPESTRTDRPVEHIKWREMPRGNYRVLVWPPDTGTAGPIPYKVVLRLKGKRPIECEGTVRWDTEKKDGHAQYAIDFDPYSKEPLQCHFEDNQLHSCKPNEGCGK
jgi:hypothetical protein